MFLFGFIQVFILSAIYVSVANSPIVREQYLAGTIYKHQLIKTIKEPRIVFIGGSNMALSINSERIEKQLQRNCVNMGLSALLGARFMLADVWPFLRERDVIVISLEYEIFGMPMLDDLPKVLFLYRPLSVKHITSWEEFKYLSDNFFLFWSNLFKVLGNDLIQKKDTINTLGIYRRSGFNDYGDFTNHWRDNSETTIRPGRSVFDPVRIDSVVNDLNYFYQKCRKKGVRVFYCYPSYPKSHAKEADNQKALSQICNRIEERLKIPMLIHYEKSLYDDELFYDSCYHMNHSGVIKKSNDLAGFLTKELAQNP